MRISRSQLCVVYAVIGSLAFIGTWGQILEPLRQHGFFEGTVRFWQDLMVNESSRFIAIDILFLGLSIVIWMIIEARRLQIPGVWLYILCSFLIAMSLFVPLFLIHRERKLAALDGSVTAGTAGTGDLVGVLLLATSFVTYGVLLFMQ